MFKIRKKGSFWLKIKDSLIKSINKKILYISSVEAFALLAIFLVMVVSGLIVYGVMKTTAVDFNGISSLSKESINKTTNSLLLFLVVFILSAIIMFGLILAVMSVAGALEWKIAVEKKIDAKKIKKIIKSLGKKYYAKFFALNSAYVVFFLVFLAIVWFLGTVLALIFVSILPKKISYSLGKITMLFVMAAGFYPLFVINALFAKTEKALDSFVNGIKKYFRSWAFITTFVLFILASEGIGALLAYIDRWIIMAVAFPVLSTIFFLLSLGWAKTISYEIIEREK